jgi:hypothetical protein
MAIARTWFCPRPGGVEGVADLAQIVLATHSEHDLQVGTLLQLRRHRACHPAEEPIDLVGAGGYPQRLEGVMVAETNSASGRARACHQQLTAILGRVVIWSP